MVANPSLIFRLELLQILRIQTINIPERNRIRGRPVNVRSFLPLDRQTRAIEATWLLDLLGNSSREVFRQVQLACEAARFSLAPLIHLGPSQQKVRPLFACDLNR